MITIRDRIKQRIDDQFQYLEMMIERFPILLENYKKEQESEFKIIASEVADGDKEIEYSVHSELSKALDSLPLENEMFNSAMLLIIYSYYESVINLLAKDIGTKQQIDAICQTKKITISDEIQKEIDFLDDNVRYLRNQIAHNNNGTFRKEAKLLNIISSFDDLCLNDDIICIKNKRFLLNILQREYNVLSFLSKELGLKTKTV